MRFDSFSLKVITVLLFSYCRMPANLVSLILQDRATKWHSSINIILGGQHKFGGRGVGQKTRVTSFFDQNRLK